MRATAGAMIGGALVVVALIAAMVVKDCGLMHITTSDGHSYDVMASFAIGVYLLAFLLVALFVNDR